MCEYSQFPGGSPGGASNDNEDVNDFFHCSACAFDMCLLNYLLTYLLTYLQRQFVFAGHFFGYFRDEGLCEYSVGFSRKETLKDRPFRYTFIRPTE